MHLERRQGSFKERGIRIILKEGKSGLALCIVEGETRIAIWRRKNKKDKQKAKDVDKRETESRGTRRTDARVLGYEVALNHTVS